MKLSGHTSILQSPTSKPYHLLSLLPVYPAGQPERITVDNEPKFVGRTLYVSVYEQGVTLDVIEPSKPTHTTLISPCLQF
jgi:hypothetical protein